MFIPRFQRWHSDCFEALSASGVNHLKPWKNVFHHIHDWCSRKLTPVLVVVALAFSGGLTAQTPVDAQDDLTLFGSEDFSYSLPVLANDLGDLDSSTLTVQTTPLLGIAVPNPATGSLDYTPFPDVWGSESFRYSVMDTMGNIDSALVSFTIFGSNDPPIVNSDADSVLNSSTIVLEPLLNDNDTIDILSSIVPSTINIITPPANGFATENLATGTITYNPFLGYSGLDSLQYEVCDNGLPLPSQCGTAWIYITVIDSIEVNGDVDLCEGDSVQLLVSGVGPFTWSPAAGLSCTDCADPWATPTVTTTYTVFSDAGGCCPHSVDVTVTVIPADTAIAAGDSVSLLEDGTVIFDLLANDFFLDSASVALILGPSFGSLSITDGVAAYTPDPDAFGLDSFYYLVCSEGCPTPCDTGLAKVLIEPVNDPPIALDDVLVIDEDTPGSAPVLANDSDVDGNLDTATLTILIPPTNGVAVVDVVTGSITYTPAPDYFGPDQLTYVICDDGTPLPSECDTAILTITVNPVNDAPIAVNDSLTILEDSVGTVDVDLNDTDLEGFLDPATIIVLSGPANGGLSIDPLTGEVTYTPDPDYYGMDSFLYRICDLGTPTACGQAWVILSVLPVNDIPVLVNDSVSTDEDLAISVDVLANDSDIDGSLVTFTVTTVTAPSNGTISTVDPFTGVITYAPAPGFSGVDSFSYLVCDDGFPAPGICEEAWVFITVVPLPPPPPNTAPVASADSFAVWEDSVTMLDILANDTDEVGSIDPTTVTILTGAANGSLSVDPVSGEVTYTPDLNYYGADSFQYEVCDDDSLALCASAWVILDVLPINDAPVVLNDTVSTTEDIPVVIDVLSNDNDVDGSLVTFTVTSVSAPSDGSLTVDPLTGAITYTPDPGFVGVDSFTYLVCDDGFPTPSICEEATVIILVIPDVIVNLPPVALDDAFDWLEDSTGLINVLDNDLDIDGAIDATTVSILTPAPNGSTSVDPVTGEITYTPDLDYFGLDSFQYEVCDDGAPVLCSSAWVVLNVQPVNDAPIATDDVAATPVDVAVIVDVLANDTDVDGTPDPATLTVLDAPANGTAVPDAITGEVTYTPDAGYTGVDSFSYIVCDDGFPLPSECDTAWVFVNVSPVAPPNVAPIAANDSTVVWEDSFAIVDVLLNDVDPDGVLDEASLLILTIPEHGSAVVDPVTGEITYTPDPDYYGLDSFSYNICDTAIPPLCATAWAIVDVQPINDAPIAGDDFTSGASETVIPVDVLNNDTDVDGSPDPGTVTVTADPENGTASVDPLTGFVSYTSDAGFVGADSLQYVVCDDGFPLPSECDTAWVFITVLTPVDTNADIIAVNDTITVIEDVTQTVEVLINDFDPESNIDTGSLIILTPALNGSAVVDLVNGTVTYTPATNFFGSDSFRYQISDADVPVSSDDAWVLFTITPVEDPPIAVNDTGDLALGESVSMDVLANDFDPEGDLDTSSLTLITPPLNGSLDQVDNDYLYTPDEGWCGTDSFQYSICDGGGLCDDAWVIIYIGCDSTMDFYATDDVVSIEYGDAVFVPVLANDDPRADASCLILVTEPVSGIAEVQPDGTIRYIPNSGFSGTDCFRYSVCDSTGTMSDDARVCVEVAFEQMVVSAGISPNNDGANDFFTILGIDRYDDHEVSIYNRWGNLVFRSDNYNNDWDGTRKGKPLPAGTYFYVIRLDVKEPGGAILKGSLTLRR